MITIRSLHKTLGGTPVLRGVDLEVQEEETLALIGPSGTGKSVLLKHIVGLLEPDSGDVFVAGRSVAKANARQLADLRRQMGYVFQDAALLDSLNILENLKLAFVDANDTNESAVTDRINDVLEQVNLDPSVLQKSPRELSGGMRKRVGVARALINRPRIMLYDEPTTGLDPRNVERINALVRKNRDYLGATSIMISHDLPAVRQIADRVALLLDGKVRFHGTPAELEASDDPLVSDFINPRPEAA
ncbi:MAG TPA: ATP-binding cassette domain-containing protein [Longimicrobiales bacterium]